ncbi:hypothetical protein niasHT_018060 [Heterodera trifolii]|uniref:Uncharacterized protein n=1 Tax=Heterodera trifolii TaxID=157864 RepID=A0ABD2L0X8_9BILA
MAKFSVVFPLLLAFCAVVSSIHPVPKNCTCDMDLKTIGCIKGGAELIQGSRIHVNANTVATLCKDDCGCFYANGELKNNGKNIVSGCFKLCPLSLLNSSACVAVLSSPIYCVSKLNGTCPAQ